MVCQKMRITMIMLKRIKLCLLVGIVLLITGCVVYPNPYYGYSRPMPYGIYGPSYGYWSPGYYHHFAPYGHLGWWGRPHWQPGYHWRGHPGWQGYHGWHRGRH
jgi:hypothetical protein